MCKDTFEIVTVPLLVMSFFLLLLKKKKKKCLFKYVEEMGFKGKKLSYYKGPKLA